jgi:aspartate-semialdehyde dehydrogenase
MDNNVPLIVPEVNADAVDACLTKNNGRNIIANPNCSTAQLVVALKPLHDAFGVRRVVVSTYQAVSGAGKPAMDELFNQTRGIYVHDTVQPEIFTKQIAFNAIPHIDAFLDDGFTKEEWKMTAETKKILDPSIELVAHCVRIPVFVGHSEAVFIETDKPMTEAGVRRLLADAEGVIVVDHRANEGYVTPHEAAGEDAVYISRIRKDPTVPNGMVFWCVADNLRKGAALNSVQIAELVVARGLSGRG